MTTLHAEERGDFIRHRVGDRRDVGNRLVEPASPRHRSILRAHEARGQLEPIAGPEKERVDHRVDTEGSADDRRILAVLCILLDGPRRPDQELLDRSQPLDERI